jgi:hypothetical protein
MFCDCRRAWLHERPLRIRDALFAASFASIKLANVAGVSGAPLIEIRQVPLEIFAPKRGLLVPVIEDCDSSLAQFASECWWRSA